MAAMGNSQGGLALAGQEELLVNLASHCGMFQLLSPHEIDASGFLFGAVRSRQIGGGGRVSEEETG